MTGISSRRDSALCSGIRRSGRLLRRLREGDRELVIVRMRRQMRNVASIGSSAGGAKGTSSASNVSLAVQETVV
jgi:hypothetical protein